MLSTGLSALLLCPFNQRASGQPIKEVKLCVPGVDDKPHWPVFKTNHTGLYDKIYKKVFELSNVKVSFVIWPSNRCKSSVRNGKVDIFPGGTLSADYSVPKYAIWYTEGVVAFFNKSRLKNWTGPKSLKNKSLVSLRAGGHIEILNGLGLKNETKNSLILETPERALLMVLAGRIDVFISSIELLNTGKSRIKKPYNPQDFETKTLGRTKYYPLFPPTPRGKKLSELFDVGIMKLSKTGQLRKLFTDEKDANINNIDPLLIQN